MSRLAVVLAIVVIGAAAPARAWCEATCIAPVAQGEAHCPSHDPADGTTKIGAVGLDECPVLEAARPSAPARLDVGAPLVAGYVPATLIRTRVTPSFARPHGACTVFERSTPLRI